MQLRGGLGSDLIVEGRVGIRFNTVEGVGMLFNAVEGRLGIRFNTVEIQFNTFEGKVRIRLNTIEGRVGIRFNIVEGSWDAI